MPRGQGARSTSVFTPQIQIHERAVCMSNPIGWFEIYVQNMDRAKKFYETVFGHTLSKMESPGIDMWVFEMKPESYGAAGALIHMAGFPSGGNSTLVYFRCEDCAVEAGRVIAAGGRIQQEKTSIGVNGFIVLAVDTEGNMIGMHSMA